MASPPVGSALYGTYRVNNYAQLAVFALNGNKAAAAPTTLVALPRGVDTILPSPDGTRFAILADPRAPDPLAATRTVVEAGQTSLYLVRTDGTGGEWACPTLHDLAGGEGSSTAPFAWSPDSTQLVVLSSTPRSGATIYSRILIYALRRVDHVISPRFRMRYLRLPFRVRMRLRSLADGADADSGSSFYRCDYGWRGNGSHARSGHYCDSAGCCAGWYCFR